MSILQKSNRHASLRRQMSIKGVKDGILMLPRHRYRAVYEVSSVNFELKSEEEQDALIDTYESFLNSLPCPLQIIVRIRELDMSDYLANLNDHLVGEKEKIYKDQIKNYSEFVQDLVADNRILSRRFYVVLLCDNADFDSAKEQLTINGDILKKGFERLGIATRKLDSVEVLQLFQTFYNPTQAKQQPVIERIAQLLNSVYIQGEKS